MICKTMYALYNIQEIIRCHLCDTPVPLLYCDVCHIKLCKKCGRDHLLDDSLEHNVVSIEQRRRSPVNHKTTTFAKNQSKLQREQCKCSQCSSSDEHLGHEGIDIMKSFKSKTEILQRDLHELEKYLLPNYQDIVSNIKVQYDDLETKSKNLIRAVYQRGAEWHKEIDIIMNKKISEVNEMQNKNIDALNKQEYDITLIISEITQIIADLKELLKSKDVSNVSAYKSRNAEFRRMPLRFKFTVPSFIHQRINTEQISEQYGSLLGSHLITECDSASHNSVAMPPSPEKPILYDAQIITTLNTGHGSLNHVTCLSDNEVWTQGNSSRSKLNLEIRLSTSL